MRAAAVSSITTFRTIMWTSQNLLFSLFLTVCVTLPLSASVEVFAFVGGEAQVSCSYPEGYETYDKYLCTEVCGNDDILVTTEQGTANRYSISDHHPEKTFTATISNVQLSDAAKYWCGVSIGGLPDIYTAVTVHVKSDECCDRDHSIHSYEGSSVTISCPYPNELSNSFKYVCRGSQPSACVKQALVTTNTHGDRFTLNDTQTELTLEISAVAKQDEGSYLCGIQRSNNFDVFSRVNLTVTENPEVTTVSPSTIHKVQHREDTSTVSSHSIFFVVPGVLLLLAVVTSVFVYKYSCLGKQDDSQRPKISNAKEEIQVNEIYCNQEVAASRVNDYCHGVNQRAPQENNFYGNFSNESIYGNC